MKLAEPAQYFWGVEDVMNALGVSKPTAYKIMEESGCLAPIKRRKRVRVDTFLDYLSPVQHGGEAHE